MRGSRESPCKHFFDEKDPLLSEESSNRETLEMFPLSETPGALRLSAQPSEGEEALCTGEETGAIVPEAPHPCDRRHRGPGLTRFPEPPFPARSVLFCSSWASLNGNMSYVSDVRDNGNKSKPTGSQVSCRRRGQRSEHADALRRSALGSPGAKHKAGSKE